MNRASIDAFLMCQYNIVIFYIIINFVCIGFIYIISIVKGFLNEYYSKRKEKNITKNIIFVFSTKEKLFIELLQCNVHNI